MILQETIPVAKESSNVKASKWLSMSKVVLFSIAMIGQLAFAMYIFFHFGGTAIKGEWDTWAEGMIHGVIEGDPLGNIALFMHLFLAFVITVGGPLQFIPKLRTKARKFHKYNGRIYVMTALLISTGALFMVWHREATVGGELGRLAISGNALLIIAFSILTWKTALKGDFNAHRKWAIRNYLVVSGVWFFRISYGIWFLVTNFKGYGVDEMLTGPFDRFAYFASYLIPLVIFEIYERAKNSHSNLRKNLTAAFLVVLALFLGAGIFLAANIFWIPALV